MNILTAIVAFLTALPKVLALAEMLIKTYEAGVKTNEKKLLEKADDDVTKFVRRVQASNGVREDGVSGVTEVNDPSTDNKCDCGGTRFCVRCLENGK